MHVPPVENLTFTSLKEYKEVLETVPLDFSEEDVTWVASNFSGAAGVLEAEAVELRNCLLFFGCVLEEFRVIVANLEDWMAAPPPPPPLGCLPCSAGMSPR